MANYIMEKHLRTGRKPIKSTRRNKMKKSTYGLNQALPGGIKLNNKLSILLAPLQIAIGDSLLVETFGKDYEKNYSMARKICHATNSYDKMMSTCSMALRILRLDESKGAFDPLNKTVMMLQEIVDADEELRKLS